MLLILLFLDFWHQKVLLSLLLLWMSNLCFFWSQISTFTLDPIVSLLFKDIVPEISLLSPALLKFPLLTGSFPSSCKQAVISYILTKTQNSCPSLAIASSFCFHPWQYLWKVVSTCCIQQLFSILPWIHYNMAFASNNPKVLLSSGLLMISTLLKPLSNSQSSFYLPQN